MATYKVIQDIEAEDKLIGPLTLRQCIYAAIAALGGYFSFIALSKGASFLVAIFLPPTIFGAFFAFPWGRDQPTEIWALAKIRFYLKSRRRIWDQSGVKELVTITAPKHEEKIYTNNLTHEEVQSRLSALARTLDSRGWVLKNADTVVAASTFILPSASSDRLVDLTTNVPVEVADPDLRPSDDMLDEANNPRAQELTKMMAASSNAHHQQIVQQLEQPAGQSLMPELPAPAPGWFMAKPLDLPSVTTSPIAAEPSIDEEALAEELRAQREKAQQLINFQHMKVIQPLGTRPVRPAPSAPHSARHEPPVDPGIIGELASNDDLNIATISRIANKKDAQSDEVVISLHNHNP